MMGYTTFSSGADQERYSGFTSSHYSKWLIIVMNSDRLGCGQDLIINILCYSADSHVDEAEALTCVFTPKTHMFITLI